MAAARLRTKVIAQHERERSVGAGGAGKMQPAASTNAKNLQPAVAQKNIAATTTKAKSAGKPGRGAAAAASATLASAAAAAATNLLKIEPYVPILNSRPPITQRSHSNLSSAHLKRTLDYVSAQQAAVEQQRQHRAANERRAARQLACSRRRSSRNTVSRPRSRSNSSSCASNPTAGKSSDGRATCGESRSACAIMPSSAVSCKQQPNGIFRIARSTQERQKLPDRINYDRRGLAAIPIFENETNLRLLSLQHNLINALHIPGEAVVEAREAEAVGKSTTAEGVREGGRPGPRFSTNGRAKSCRGRQQSKVKMPLALPRGTKVRCHLPSMSNSLAQKPVLCNASSYPLLHPRFLLKKSKSFVANGSRPSRQMAFSVQKADLMSAMSTHKQKSFDSGAGASVLTTTTTTDSTASTAIGDEQLRLQDFALTNNQLAASYGPTFQNLVFLDLYDNQIERIANLDGLPALSVLLLGKNRIWDLSGLASLRATLRVLDLHGNRITSIGHKINCLAQLQSLNLAGNHIRQINQDDFEGLLQLKELNLKRNRIRRISGFQHLSALQRLWLCQNELQRVEDMASVGKATSLLEMSIEDNPVSLAGDCASFLVSYLPRLQSLSRMPISVEVRRAAMAWRRNKEFSETCGCSLSADAFNSLRREEVIANARTNWELLRSQQTLHAAAGNCSAQQRELTRIGERGVRRAASAGSDTGSQEFVKLPLIQQPQQPQQKATHHAGDRDAQQACSDSANSSRSANADSSSSCYGSGDEESESAKLDGAGEEAARVENAKRGQELLNEDKTASDRNETCAVKVTTAVAGDAAATGETNSETQLNAATTTNQQRVEVGRDNNNNSSPRGISTACLSLLPQADKPRGRHRNAAPTTTAATRATLPRGPTTATLVAARSCTLSLSLPSNSNNNNTKSNLRRYTPGSLVRSHTVGNGKQGAAAKSKATSKADGNQSQQQQQRSSAATNGTAESRSNSVQELLLSNSMVASATTAAAAASNECKSNANNQSPPLTPPPLRSTHLGAASASKPSTEREHEQGGDYLIEICGHHLNVYGQGALRHLDKPWSPAKANDVHTLSFSYINFNHIAPILGRVKARFPYSQHFVFRETNISCLGQLNALAELLGLESLSIDPGGNAITTKDAWRLYAVYRLAHWGLKRLNGCEVSEAEVEAANVAFAGLSNVVLHAMPEAMLQPLLERLHLDETCGASKLSPREWLRRAEKPLRVVVSKEALQWRKPTGGGLDGSDGVNSRYRESSGGVGASLDTCAARERGKQQLAELMVNTCNAVEKLRELEKLWPSLLLDIVRNTLIDYAHMDVYLHTLMEEIMK